MSTPTYNTQLRSYEQHLLKSGACVTLESQKKGHKQYVIPLILQIYSSKGLLICYIKLFYGLLLQTGM